MIPQAVADRPKSPAVSKPPSENRPPPWDEILNSPALGNLVLQIPQAEGRGKAMDTNIQDKVDRVIDKLETISNLFEFYWYAREKTDFNKNSVNGVCLIIADCIAELEGVKK
jgi:hypothetical protein